MPYLMLSLGMDIYSNHLCGTGNLLDYLTRFRLCIGDLPGTYRRHIHLTDLLGGLGSAFGEFPHLIGNHSKAPPLFVRMSRFNGSIECEDLERGIQFLTPCLCQFVMRGSRNSCDVVELQAIALGHSMPINRRYSEGCIW